MKNIHVILGAAALILIAGYVYSSAFPQEGQNTEAVHIGFIAPLTGPFPQWGETILRGMKLAVEDTETTFFVEYQDDGCSPQQGVSIGRQMLDIQKIKIIIGPGCNDVFNPLAPIADQHGALLISTGLLDDSIFEGHSSVINFATQISREGEYLAAYFKTVGYKRVALLYANNEDGNETAKRFPGALEMRGVSLVDVQTTTFESTDFRTDIVKILQTNPDAIFIHQAETQIGIFLKQLREQGSTIPVYAVYSAESNDTKSAAGSAYEGLYYTFPVNSSEDSAELASFKARYAAAYGADQIPSASSMFVYDGMMILDKALAECEQNDTRCIKKFFYEFGVYNGISGEMRFNEDGSIVRPFGIKRVINGEYTWITKDIKP